MYRFFLHDQLIQFGRFFEIMSVLYLFILDNFVILVFYSAAYYAFNLFKLYNTNEITFWIFEN